MRNFLKHAGILEGAAEHRPSIELDMPCADCFTFSQSEGLVEPAVDLGAEVHVGDLLARVYSTDRIGGVPEEYRAKLDGILAARHFSGLVLIGDCLAVVARTF